MDIDNRLRFGKYVESLRKSKGKSLRATAKAIQISPQYYSEVEKGRSNTFTSERLKMLVHFLNLDENEVHTLYDLAAQSRSSNLNTFFIIISILWFEPLKIYSFICSNP